MTTRWLQRRGLPAPSADQGHVAEAARELDSAEPEARYRAALYLGEVAKEGVDISRALPPLASLLRDPAAGEKALAAVAAYLTTDHAEAAGLSRARRAADVAPMLKVLCELLASEPDVVRILDGLQRQGVDISPAFETLASLGHREAWALETLRGPVPETRAVPISPGPPPEQCACSSERPEPTRLGRQEGPEIRAQGEEQSSITVPPTPPVPTSERRPASSGRVSKRVRRALFRLASMAMPRGIRALWLPRGLRSVGLQQR